MQGEPAVQHLRVERLTMFTKQHYELLAELIRTTLPAQAGSEFLDQLLDAFQADNQRFNRQWFLEAAGLK